MVADKSLGGQVLLGNLQKEQQTFLKILDVNLRAAGQNKAVAFDL